VVSKRVGVDELAGCSLVRVAERLDELERIFLFASVELEPPSGLDLVSPQTGSPPFATAPGPTTGSAPICCIIPTMSSSPQPSVTSPSWTRSIPTDVTATDFPLGGMP
jgi:hypothetical protein